MRAVQRVVFLKVALARQPASTAQVEGAMTDVNSLFELYDEQCGDKWGQEHCAQDGCDERNETCVKELDVTGYAQSLMTLSAFYAGRRERQHLLNIQEACNSVECGRFVQAQLAANAAWLKTKEPRIDDYVIDWSVHFGLLLRDRPCNGELACLSQLVDPVLSATSVQAATDALNVSKSLIYATVYNREVEEVSLLLYFCVFFFFSYFAKRIIEWISRPAAICLSFEQTIHKICQAQRSIEVDFVDVLTRNFSFYARLTPELKSRIFGMLSSCWSGCRLLKR
jgi:hypothetical protein